MTNKLIAICALTLATAGAYAQSSSQVSEATRNSVMDLVHTNLSATNTAGALGATGGSLTATGQGAVADVTSAGGHVTDAATATGAFVNAQTLAPTYNHILVPTGHGLVKAGTWIKEKVPAATSAVATGVVDTIEFTGTKSTGAVSGMGKAIGGDTTAVAQTNVSATNTAGTAEGTTKAQTLGETTGDSGASVDFTTAPVQKIREFKEERRQAVHKVAQMYKEAIEDAATDEDRIALLVQFGTYYAAQAVEVPAQAKALLTVDAKVAMAAVAIYGVKI